MQTRQQSIRDSVQSCRNAQFLQELPPEFIHRPRDYNPLGLSYEKNT